MKAALITALIGAAGAIIAALIGIFPKVYKPATQPVPRIASQPTAKSQVDTDPTSAPVFEPPSDTGSSELEEGRYILLSASGLEMFDIGSGVLLLRSEGPERFDFTIEMAPKAGYGYAAATGTLFRTAGRWILETESSSHSTNFVTYGAHPLTVVRQDDIVTFQTEDWTMEWARA